MKKSTTPLITVSCTHEERDNFKKFCRENCYSQTKYVKSAVNAKSGEKIFFT